MVDFPNIRDLVLHDQDIDLDLVASTDLTLADVSTGLSAGGAAPIVDLAQQSGGQLLGDDGVLGTGVWSNTAGIARAGLVGDTLVLGGADDALEGQLTPSGLFLGPIGSETLQLTPSSLTIGAQGAARVILDANAANGLMWTDAAGNPLGQWAPGNGDLSIGDPFNGPVVIQLYNEDGHGEIDVNDENGVPVAVLEGDVVGSLTLYAAGQTDPQVLDHDALAALLALL